MRLIRYICTIAALSSSTAGLSSCKTANDADQVTPERLVDALVTVADMESKWDQVDRKVFSTRGDELPAIDTTWCTEGAQAAASLVQLAGDRGAIVEMRYKSTTTSSRLMSEDTWNDENASAYMLEIDEAVSRCAGKTWTDDAGVTATLSKLTAPDVGDDASSYSVTITPPSALADKKFAVVWRTVVARLNNTVMVLQVWDTAKSVGAPDLIPEADWTNIVSLAVDKLARL